MKKTIIMFCLIVTMLAISACGSSTSQGQQKGNPPDGANQTGSTKSVSSKDNTDYLDTSYTNALSVPMQLIIGTLKTKGYCQ
jgi:ABC-type Fe3+-citrate transport system substrate-binding protein